MRNLWEIYEKITQCNRHEEKQTHLSVARAWKVTLCSTMRNTGKGASAARGWKVILHGARRSSTGQNVSAALVWKVTLRSTSIIPQSLSQQPWIGNSPFISIVTLHNARKCVSGARTWKVTLCSTNQTFSSNMMWKVIFCGASERQESAYWFHLISAWFRESLSVV